jgi:hypothetical protein
VYVHVIFLLTKSVWLVGCSQAKLSLGAGFGFDLINHEGKDFNY